MKARVFVALAVLLVATAAAPRLAQADIVSIANATACSGTGPGGTICAGTGNTPFNITALQNGSLVLQAVVGTNTSPVYEFINNTSSTINSFSFAFNGTLATGQFLYCQNNGGFSGASCSLTPNNTTLFGGTQPGGVSQDGSGAGSGIYTGKVPAVFTWTGLNIKPGQLFDITFASFGNGASGTLSAVPESGTGILVGVGLLFLAITAFVKRL